MRILGVWSDTALSWGANYDALCKKLAFISAVIFKLCILIGVPRYVLLRCYSALYLPHLILAAPIWGFAAKKHAQRLVVHQNNVIRMIYRLKRNESALWVMKRNGILPFKLLVLRQSASLIHKLARSFDNLFAHHFNVTTLHHSRSNDGESLYIVVCPWHAPCRVSETTVLRRRTAIQQASGRTAYAKVACTVRERGRTSLQGQATGEQ